MNQLAQVFVDLPDFAHKEFVKNTPVRSGNARRNTKLVNNDVVADYQYSRRLEEGWSKQAPDGMIKPTEEAIYKEVNRRLRGL